MFSFLPCILFLVDLILFLAVVMLAYRFVISPCILFMEPSLSAYYLLFWSSWAVTSVFFSVMSFFCCLTFPRSFSTFLNSFWWFSCSLSNFRMISSCFCISFSSPLIEFWAFFKSNLFFVKAAFFFSNSLYLYFNAAIVLRSNTPFSTRSASLSLSALFLSFSSTLSLFLSLFLEFT